MTITQKIKTKNSDLELLFSTRKLSSLAKLLIISQDSISLPKEVLLLLYIISQLQVFSIIIRTAKLSLSCGSQILKDAIDTVSNIISLDGSINLFKSSSHIYFVMGLICLYLIAILILLSHMLMTLSRSEFPSELTKKLWSMGILFHSLLFFYPIHLICIFNIFTNFNLEESIEIKTQMFIQIGSLISLTLNLSYAIGALLCLSLSVKTNHILSAKSILLMIQDGALKLIIPFLWIFSLKQESYTLSLLFINMIFTMIRDWLFFEQLPYYNLEVLRISAKFNGASTVFALNCLISNIMSFMGFEESLLMSIMLWGILVFMVVKLYATHLENKFRRILFFPNKSIKPYHLTHYWYIYKDLSDKAEYSRLNKTKFDFLSFLLQDFKKRDQQHCDFSLPNLSNPETKSFLKLKILNSAINLIKDLIKENPKISLLKLTKSCLYVKLPNSLGLANQINVLKSSSSFIEKANFTFLQLKIIRKLNKNNIQQLLIEDENNLEESLDLEQYLYLQGKFEEVKEKIKEQVSYQTKFWEIFQASNFDFDSLISLANLVNNKSREIQRYSKMHDLFVESCFWEPLLIQGLYFYHVQNKSSEGSRLILKYLNFQLKVKNNSIPFNILQKHVKITNSLYFIVSSSPEEIGKIIRCSNNTSQVLRTPKNEPLVGKSVNIFSPQRDSMLKGHLLGISLENIPYGTWNNPKEMQLADGEGYLLSCHVYLTIQFSSRIGLNYLIFIQPLEDNVNRFVWIKQSGEVVSYSRTFKEDMNINSKESELRLNIFSICPKLSKRIEALKSMYQHSKGQKTERKLEDVKSFETTDNTILLGNNKQSNAKISFLENIFHNENFKDEDKLVFHPFSSRELKDSIYINSIYSAEVTKRSKLILYQGNIKFFPNYTNNENDRTLEIRLQNLSIISPELGCSHFELNSSPKVTKPFVNSASTKVNKKIQKISTKNGQEHQSRVLSERRELNSDCIDVDFDDSNSSHVCTVQGDILFDQFNIREDHCKEIVQEILEARFYAKSAKNYGFYFIFIKGLLLACLLWFSFNAGAVSSQVLNTGNLLQNIYLRCFWTNLANQETRLWTAVRGGLVNIPGIVDADIETETTNLTFHKMDEFNHKLWESVKDKSPEIQSALYEKNVRVFERDENGNLKDVSVENTFQVVTKIVTHGFKNVYKPQIDVPLEDYIEKESRFIFDNSHGDLLIASERLIGMLQSKMELIFSNADRVDTAILFIGAFSNLLLMIISSYFLLKIYKEFCRFMNILFTIPQEEALQVQLNLSAFSDVLSGNHQGIKYIEALYLAQSSRKIKTENLKIKSNDKSKTTHQNQANYQTLAENIKRKNIFLFLRIFIVQIILLSALIFYYYWSANRVQIMKTQQRTIDSALQNINLQSMISVQLQTLIMDNLSGKIRNIPIAESFNRDIDQISKVSELERNFRNEEGKLSEKQRAILLDYSCLEVYSSLYLIPPEITIGECHDLSAGTGRIGLIKTNFDMVSELSFFIVEFQTYQRDIETLKEVYKRAIGKFIRYIDVSIVLFLLSYETTESDFNNLISTLKYQGMIFAVIAVIIVVGFAFLSWIISSRHLASKEFDPKEVLALVPPKLIIANSQIKRYITQAVRS